MTGLGNSDEALAIGISGLPRGRAGPVIFGGAAG